MSSGKNLIKVIFVVLVILLIGIFLFRKSYQSSSSNPPVNIPNSSSPEAATSSANMNETIINVTSEGFNPSSVTIKVGQSVTWANVDTAPHQVNSNPHPTHTDYPPLNSIGLLQPGDKKSLSFPTPGVYKFHDHLFPQFTGSVTVQ